MGLAQYAPCDYIDNDISEYTMDGYIAMNCLQ